MLLRGGGLVGHGTPGGLGEQLLLVDPGLARGDALPRQPERQLLLGLVLLLLQLVVDLPHVVGRVLVEITRRELGERVVDLLRALAQQRRAPGVVIALPCRLVLRLLLLLRDLRRLLIGLLLVERELLRRDLLLRLDLLITECLCLRLLLRRVVGWGCGTASAETHDLLLPG